MTEKKVNIEDSWFEELHDEFEKEYFLKLKEFLIEEKKRFSVYPPGSQIFSAFNLTPIDKLKVVILGQDPYHGPRQAHGLCFSVPQGVKIPPSLVNIYKELKADIGFSIPESGNLESWAKQGVFLLNATLTVRANTAGSHQKKGWEIFTDTVIKTISDKRENIVFVLWGNYAAAKEALIDKSKHLILKAAHPSPLSAYNGFYGCKHFSKINNYLSEKGIETIRW
ncbi:MAG TPA: uracil-DNA glycosylase [Bacteroidales bacterium]|nr:uracil-DNA glycosylase [Bacteroidales bacterium]